MSSVAFRFRARNVKGVNRPPRRSPEDFIIDKPFQCVYPPRAFTLSKACDSHRVSLTPMLSPEQKQVPMQPPPAVFIPFREGTLTLPGRRLLGMSESRSCYSRPIPRAGLKVKAMPQKCLAEHGNRSFNRAERHTQTLTFSRLALVHRLPALIVPAMESGSTLNRQDYAL